MEFTPTNIPEVVLISPDIFEDDRGFFLETFQMHKFAEAGLPESFVQDNHSGSYFGTLRGLHYQIRQRQGKLIRVIVGQVFEVAVDIRQNSPNFGKWVGVCLSAADKKQLWVPSGFANGFLVLSNWAEIVYKVTDFYAPQWERSIIWNDPVLGIDWPIPNMKSPILSEKDRRGHLLKDAELFNQ